MFDGIRLTNERLIMASGLTLAGLLLKRTSLAKRLNETKLKDNAEPHIKNSEIALTYIGLLCQGKITTPREGKTVYTGSVYWSPGNLARKVRIVYQVIV